MVALVKEALGPLCREAPVSTEWNRVNMRAALVTGHEVDNHVIRMNVSFGDHDSSPVKHVFRMRFDYDLSVETGATKKRCDYSLSLGMEMNLWLLDEKGTKCSTKARCDNGNDL